MDTRFELNAMAKEKGIKYYYHYSTHDLRVKLNIEKPVVTREYSVGELRNMAKDRGYIGYSILKQFELIKMLGLPKPWRWKNNISFRCSEWHVLKIFYRANNLQTITVPTPTPKTMGMVFRNGLISTVSFSSTVTLGVSSCVCFCFSIFRLVGILVILSWTVKVPVAVLCFNVLSYSSKMLSIPLSALIRSLIFSTKDFCIIDQCDSVVTDGLTACAANNPYTYVIADFWRSLTPILVKPFVVGATM